MPLVELWRPPFEAHLGWLLAHAEGHDAALRAGTSPAGTALAHQRGGGSPDASLHAAGHRILSEIEGLERAKAQLESRLLEAYGALHTVQEQQLARSTSTTRAPISAGQVVTPEIACATGVGPGEVSRRLELALAPRRHRVLLEAMREGSVGLYRALQVVAETRALPDDVLPDLEATVLAPAPDGSVASQRLFASRLRRCVRSADHGGQDERRCSARGRRTAFGRLTDDGMGFITVVASAERVVGALDRVDALARSARAAGDERTLDQLRSDLLTDLALFGTVAEADREPASAPASDSASADGPGTSRHVDERRAAVGSASPVHGPTCGRWLAAAPPAVVRIVVPFEVAMGASEAACELPGHGWVTAAHARQVMIAAGSVWQRLAVDVDTGRTLELSTERYVPTAAMVEQVRAVDGVCRAPGCQVPADRGDLDHVSPWPIGPTHVTNLQSLSRGCHNLKTAGAWTVDRDAEAMRWTTLAGREYVTYPRNWREALTDPGAHPPRDHVPDPSPPPPF
jgi:hypothetical protein